MWRAVPRSLRTCRDGVRACRSAKIAGFAVSGTSTMIEVGQVNARIADLKGRVASLRGYL
jgi:hypothetical protein